MNLLSLLRLTARRADSLSRVLKERYYVEDITPGMLRRMGIEAVILDHDGVLGPSLSLAPDAAGLELLRVTLQVFGPGRVFVLSNTRSRRNSREKAYHEALPEIVYIKAKRKPDGEGLAIASSASGIPKEKFGVIDDGMLTGVLMAVEHGARPVYAVRRNLSESLMAKVFRLGTTVPQMLAVSVSGLFCGPVER